MNSALTGARRNTDSSDRPLLLLHASLAAARGLFPERCSRRVFAVRPAREFVRLGFPHFTRATFTIQVFLDATSNTVCAEGAPKTAVRFCLRQYPYATDTGAHEAGVGFPRVREAAEA